MSGGTRRPRVWRPHAGKPQTIRPPWDGDCAGFAGVGILLALAVTATALLLLCEFYRAFTVKRSIDVELTRAVNTSVSLSVSDEHRRDRVALLDEGLAYTFFYEYLHDELGLDGSLRAWGAHGEALYSLEIAELLITAEPPQMSVRGEVVIDAGLLGRAAPGALRLPVRGGSINRRVE